MEEYKRNIFQCSEKTQIIPRRDQWRLLLCLLSPEGFDIHFRKIAYISLSLDKINCVLAQTHISQLATLIGSAKVYGIFRCVL